MHFEYCKYGLIPFTKRRSSNLRNLPAFLWELQIADELKLKQQLYIVSFIFVLFKIIRAMKPVLFFIISFIAFGFYSNKEKDKKFTNAITNEEVSLVEMSKNSSYTVFYCWADWCAPCLSGMKSKLIKTKAITDSIGLPIKYNTILYSLNINDKSKTLMQNVYDSGIEAFHRVSPNAFTQKLAISADFKEYQGFEKEFMVPRIILVDNNGNLLTSYFPLNYDKDLFIEKMKLQFPSYFVK